MFAVLLFWLAGRWWLGKRKSSKDQTEETSDDSRPSKPSPLAGSQRPIITPTLHFDHERFATSLSQFRPWYYHLFEGFPFPIPVAAALVVLLVFLGGLLLSWAIGFGRVYVRTPAIYVGNFGIAWVLAVLQQGSLQVHTAYERLRPCFLIDDEEYRHVTTSWFNRMASHAGNFQVSMCFFALAVAVVYIGMFRPDIAQALDIRSLRPLLFFPPPWFAHDNLTLKCAILCYYGFSVALPLGTSFRLMVLNLLFLLDLRHLPVIPAPEIIRARLRDVTNLYMFISASWFVGVSLFGVVLFRTLDMLSALFLGSLSLLGVLVFLTPQVVFRQYLARSYRLVCDWSLHALNRHLGIELHERTRSHYLSELDAHPANLNGLATIIQTSSKPGALIYDAGDFLILLGGQLIVFASAFFQTLVERFFIGVSP